MLSVCLFLFFVVMVVLVLLLLSCSLRFGLGYNGPSVGIALFIFFGSRLLEGKFKIGIGHDVGVPRFGCDYVGCFF